MTLNNGVSFFSANDAKHGRELWRSDGTAGGTRIVCDIHPGVPSSFISHMIPFRDGVAFFVQNDQGGLDLFISNGTSVGTKRVVTVESHTLPSSLSATDQRLVWLAGDMSDNNIQRDGRLWSSDGTAAGTAMVAELHSMVQQIPFHPPVSVGNRVVFGTPERVWSTDGTSAGTFTIDDQGDYGYVDSIGQLTSGGGFIYWTPNKLYITDGTLAGTQLLGQIDKNTGGGTPMIVGDKYYFTRVYENATTDLWQSDGTVAGTHKVVDVPGLVYEAKNAGNTLVMATRIDTFPNGSGEGITDFFLYALDPSTQQVTLLHHFGTDCPNALVTAGGSVFFKSTNPSWTWGVWRTDGTVAGTMQIRTITGYGEYEAVGNRLALTTNNGMELIDPAAPNQTMEPTTSSASLSGGVLRVFGTNADDSIRIFIYANDHTRLIVQINGVKHSFALSQVTRVKVYGYSGNDEIAFLERNGGINIRTNVDGGAGSDAIYTSSGRDTVVGSFGDDTIWGGNNDDMIDGGLGDDSIVGGNGNDTATGGDGSDFISGGKGADQLGGGDDQSADTLYGNDGGDVLFGTQVIDIFFAGTGKLDPSDLILD